MYPSIVDMNENESSKYLRMLELDAYANMLAALRAQGPPTSDKLKLLKEIGTALRIPQERCKAEIRKVILDERLNTIAYFSCGQLETSEEWIKEGRRLISLMPRVAPQTLYSAIADDVAEVANIVSEQSPSMSTDRKRTTSASQSNVPESIKSQQFRISDSLKNDDSKKRKLPFVVENSPLAQHLIAPSKVSRIQQLYRQKARPTIKDDQKPKVKQETEQDNKNLSQQQHQSKIQKLPLSSAASSPKINILQNISIQPPNKEEETIEQIKNEINNYMVQKNPDQTNCTSPQPSCSNENQAPKQQKQTVVNIKPNANITYKHISSPGPSSELQKPMKVSTPRKSITKTIPGQKLIIVSSAQSIATSSILQRTLTIPFVKNISVKNFDKFKIVSTSTNTSSLQIASLANANTNTFATNSVKHKVVTVRTNNSAKKMIPLSHLQALSAKGSIKMLPIGGKILTKNTTATTSSLFIMSNVGGIQALTKSTTSTPVIMTSRPQDPIVNETKGTDNSKCNENDFNENSSTIEISKSTESTNTNMPLSSSNDKNSLKLPVLKDILKDPGTPSETNDHYSEDIETQISQLTEIPQNALEKNSASDEVDAEQNFEVAENLEMVECQEEHENKQCNNGTDQDTERLLKDLEGEDSSDVVISNLDSEVYKDKTETPILKENASKVDQGKSTNLSGIKTVN